LPVGLSALHQLQVLIAVNRGQTVGVGQSPVINKAVVATGALEIHAHEDLRNILRGLHGGQHAGVDGAAPEDAAGESFTGPGGIDQLADESVVRLILDEGGIEPAGICRRPPSI